jgi:hypothetical protein
MPRKNDDVTPKTQTQSSWNAIPPGYKFCARSLADIEEKEYRPLTPEELKALRKRQYEQAEQFDKYLAYCDSVGAFDYQKAQLSLLAEVLYRSILTKAKHSKLELCYVDEDDGLWTESTVIADDEREQKALHEFLQNFNYVRRSLGYRRDGGELEEFHIDDFTPVEKLIELLDYYKMVQR